MSSAIFQYAPNRVLVDIGASSAVTTWGVVGKDGNLYANLAALKTAGVPPWPNLDPGGFLQFLEVRSMINTGLSDGSPFGFLMNVSGLPTPPTSLTGRLVSGAGQTLFEPGPVYNVWIAKGIAGDIVTLTGGF